MANIFFPDDAPPNSNPDSTKMAFDLALEELYKTAPVTAKALDGFYGTFSEYTGKTMTTLADALQHHEMWLFNQDQQQKGRPPSTAVAIAESKAANKQRLAQSKEERAASKALYEARLARYARRRTAISELKQAVADAGDNKRAALKALSDQWDAYIAHLRSQVRAAEAINADSWPD